MQHAQVQQQSHMQTCQLPQRGAHNDGRPPAGGATSRQGRQQRCSPPEKTEQRRRSQTAPPPPQSCQIAWASHPRQATPHPHPTGWAGPAGGSSVHTAAWHKAVWLPTEWKFEYAIAALDISCTYPKRHQGLLLMVCHCQSSSQHNSAAVARRCAPRGRHLRWVPPVAHATHWQ